MQKNIFPMITDEDRKLPFYIDSIGYNDNQEYIDRPDGYPSYQWLYCTKGKGILLIDGNEYILSGNTGFIYTPGTAHKYHALTEEWGTKWLTFDGYAIPRLLKHLNINGRYNVYQINNPVLLEKLYNELFDTANSARPSKSNECSYLLYKFLMELNSIICNSQERLKTEKRFQLEPVIAYMHKNYSSGLSLEDLSALINVTPQHICRLFKQAFNLRPFEYLTGIRIQKAKELLTTPGSFKLSEIAGLSGYNDTSYFCAVFKDSEGITPVEFRKLHVASRTEA